MKKWTVYLLIALLIFTTGCGNKSQGEGKALLEEYMKNVDAYQVPVREVGEPASHIYMDDEIAVGILYPKTGFDVLDQELNQWIEETAETYIEVAKEEGDIQLPEDAEVGSTRAELSVAYDAYRVGETIVSIKMSGSYISPALAHPVDIIKTFTADERTGELVYVNDLLGKSSQSAFENMLMIQTGVEESDVDEHIFDHSLFTRDGIEITLNRGDYLPMSEGTKTAFFAYEDIAYLLDLDFDYTWKPEVEDGGDETITDDTIAVQKIDPNKPMIALTFDDGPSAHTDRLLDIFAEHGGKGTFFVVGNLIDGREETLVRMHQEGHEVANHTWSHRQLTNLTAKEVKDQLMMTRAKIYDVTGKDSLVVRAPYGDCDEMVLGVGKELGVSFYNWSIDTLDWLNKDPQAIYNEIINHAEDGDIVLCHDLHETTVDSMERVIPKLIEEGYQLVTISELMEHSDQKVQPGGLYTCQ
ncbi:MAG: polysaccharide deacetylase family protein [Firmicutes bacterium]|nr:polysaccharide deacetylase family protein [Bacillota bacterium]